MLQTPVRRYTRVPTGFPITRVTQLLVLAKNRILNEFKVILKNQDSLLLWCLSRSVV